MGSDYTHNDAAQEMDYQKLLKQRAEKGEITESAANKIIYDNPRVFYGI